MSTVAITVGALGAAGALFMKMKKRGRAWHTRSHKVADLWARPGMSVTFRAELKPGRDASERTFRVLELLPSGRVLLEGIAGEHAETEFEPVR